MPRTLDDVMQMLRSGSPPSPNTASPAQPFWDGRQWVYPDGRVEPYNPYGAGGEGMRLRLAMDPAFAAEMAKQAAWNANGGGGRG